MIEFVKPEAVIVNRHGETFPATTNHAVYTDEVNEKTKETVKGRFLGIGVRMDSGHVVYAQPDMLTAV